MNLGIRTGTKVFVPWHFARFIEQSESLSMFYGVSPLPTSASATIITMIKTLLFPSPRPYWHVDLKWVSGILFFFAVGISLLLFNLSALTERERATTISATVIATMFSKDGLDDPKDIEILKQQAALIPGDIITPIPQFPTLQVSKADLMAKSPRELRIALFKQLTEPIYDKGLKGAAKEFTADPVSQEKFQKDATLLGAFTKSTHDAFERALLWTSLFAGVMLLLLVYFSAGWGRLVSPGLVLLLVSPLGTIFSLLLLYPPKDGDAPFAALPASVAQEIGTSLNQSYMSATLIGVGLLVLAGVGKIVQTALRHKKMAK